MLILLRENMFPNEPATTSSIFFARMAVAACSRELPYILWVNYGDESDEGVASYASEVEPRDKNVSWAGDIRKVGIKVLHADLRHLCSGDRILVGVFTRIYSIYKNPS